MRRHPLRIALAGSPDRLVRSGVVAFPLNFAAADTRADDGLRQVAILAESVRFERQVAGVAMRVAIPLALYRGVALELHPLAGPDAFRLTLTLVHQDRELDVRLFEAVDDDDITAEWQYWAQRFGLPLLIADQDGTLREPFSRLGLLIINRPSPRRLPASLASRRPRFLTRRRTGKLPAQPRVHREREIIARD